MYVYWKRFGFNAHVPLLAVYGIADVWRRQQSKGIWSTPNSFSSVFSSMSARNCPHRVNPSARVCIHWPTSMSNAVLRTHLDNFPDIKYVTVYLGFM